ncbi:MAG: phage tail protein [Parvularculaceae bacterium]
MGKAMIAAAALAAAGISDGAQTGDSAVQPGEKIKNWNENRSADAPADILSRVREFVVNPARTDPYKRINFRVRWDGEVIAGVTYVSPLARTTETIEYRGGSDPADRKMTPGLTTIRPVVLKRGVTHDASFEEWADEVWNPAGPGGISLANYRKDVVVDLLNLSGQVVKRYVLYRCWPTQYVALDALDAGADLAAEERLVIQCESWERDKSVVEPRER